jgi:hypothetical protein
MIPLLLLLLPLLLLSDPLQQTPPAGSENLGSPSAVITPKNCGGGGLWLNWVNDFGLI